MQIKDVSPRFAALETLWEVLPVGRMFAPAGRSPRPGPANNPTPPGPPSGLTDGIIIDPARAAAFQTAGCSVQAAATAMHIGEGALECEVHLYADRPPPRVEHYVDKLRRAKRIFAFHGSNTSLRWPSAVPLRIGKGAALAGNGHRGCRSVAPSAKALRSGLRPRAYSGQLMGSLRAVAHRPCTSCRC
jgi:hypothetical protein